MKKILIISSEFPPGPGGIGQHSASLMLALSKNAQVDVLCFQDYANEKQIEQYNSMLPKNITIHHFPKRSQSPFSYLKRFTVAKSHVQRIRPSNIIVSGLFPLWIGAYLKKYYPSILIQAFIHGSEVTPTKGWKAKLTHWSYQQLDKIYPVSSFTKTFLSDKLPENKIKIVPNGLDAQFLEHIQSFIKDNGKQKFRGNPSLLTVGNVTYRKGQHRVIKALPSILAKYPETHYHIVGLPTKKDNFLALAKELNVSHAITFHGRLPKRQQVFDAYQAAGIFIMLSENQPDGDIEGFGIAILEANAFGLPAIGAKGCGIEDAISSENGVLIDGNDADEITLAVEQLQNNKAEFSKGAINWANAHNWDNIVKLILE